MKQNETYNMKKSKPPLRINLGNIEKFVPTIKHLIQHVYLFDRMKEILEQDVLTNARIIEKAYHEDKFNEKYWGGKDMSNIMRNVKGSLDGLAQIRQNWKKQRPKLQREFKASMRKFQRTTKT